ncbi:MAG: hypothetical protein WKH64_03935 [Chloroflexia bacterium]
MGARPDAPGTHDPHAGGGPAGAGQGARYRRAARPAARRRRAVRGHSPRPLHRYRCATPGLAPAQQAFAVAQGQLAYYTALERVGLVRIIRSASDLERCVEEQVRYAAAEQDEAPPLGLVLSMESADPVLAPDDLEEWTRAGVRAIGPAHYGPGRYAGGTGTELG